MNIAMIHARQDYQDRIVDKANLIPANEPVFLLRGQDKHAVTALQRYTADLAADPTVDRAFVKAAEAQLDRFLDWPTRKTPDQPPPLVIGAGAL